MDPAAPAGKLTVMPPDVVFTKYPVPVAAVTVPVLGVVSQSTVPVLPNPVAVPAFEIVTPQGTVKVSPLSHNVKVPHAVLGLILFTFTSLIIEICILLLLYHYHQYFLD